jgi:hypothetical protein
MIGVRVYTDHTLLSSWFRWEVLTLLSPGSSESGDGKSRVLFGELGRQEFRVKLIPGTRLPSVKENSVSGHLDEAVKNFRHCVWDMVL